MRFQDPGSGRIAGRFVNDFFLIRTLLILLFMMQVMRGAGQQASGLPTLSGYWEGEFMPGNGLTLLFVFGEGQAGMLEGRVYMYQGTNQLQDDALADIVFSDTKLSFDIPARETPFSGRLSDDGLIISGEFRFPDGSVHPVRVGHVDEPSIPIAAPGGAGLPPEEVLARLYSPEELRSDLQFLFEHIEGTHPQPYLFISREDFRAMFEEAMSLAAHPMSEHEYFRLLAPLVASVGCVHTAIRPSDAFLQASASLPQFLPLDIGFFDGKAYVTRNLSKVKAIYPGLQVVSINGEGMEDILGLLKRAIPADAWSESHRMYEINTGFSRLLALYHGISPGYELGLVTEDGIHMTFVLPAIPPGQFGEDAPPAGSLPYHAEFPGDHASALLRIEGFFAPDWEGYNEFLRKTFAELKARGTRDLILDIRGNRGGLPFLAAELLTYLADTSFPYFSHPQDGEFAVLCQPMTPKEDRFTGSLYVLADGGCLSTSGHFLSLIRYHRLGEIIGEDAGSSFHCNDGSTELRLPATGIVLNLPRKEFTAAVQGFVKGAPLAPDHLVVPGLQDVLEGRDPQMDYVLRSIRE